MLRVYPPSPHSATLARKTIFPALHSSELSNEVISHSLHRLAESGGRGGGGGGEKKHPSLDNFWVECGREKKLREPSTDMLAPRRGMESFSSSARLKQVKNEEGIEDHSRAWCGRRSLGYLGRLLRRQEFSASEWLAGLLRPPPLFPSHWRALALDPDAMGILLPSPSYPALPNSGGGANKQLA